mgnify:CR=1 FL=1
MTTPQLQFERITKAFAGVPVLREVSFDVPAGATVGLVGENGAGKSTLMNILGGNLAPDAGRMWIDDEPFAPRSPIDAARRGIAFVHQELNLFLNLTIAENLFITGFPRTAGLPWIARAELHRRTATLLAEVGLTISPRTPVERLSTGERQLVEITRALSIDARLLILDEPTTSLGARETRRLFELLARLRARGLTMIYISHTLEDVLRLSDRIVVLRDGEVVGQGARGEFDVSRLVSLMVGRSLTQLYPTRTRAGVPAARRREPSEVSAGQNAIAPTRPSAHRTEVGAEPSALPSSAPLLEVRGLSQPGVVHDISFSLTAGEVLGVFGLMGAGRSELARLLFGLEPHGAGEIRLEGRALPRITPQSAIRQGLAFLTENRRDEGLCLHASIADNIALVSLREHCRGATGWLDLDSIGRAVRRMREAVRLTPTASNSAPVKLLSGGNQQKVVLAKWLLVQPRVLILDEPTRGIDVGAKFEIYQLILGLADGGAGVLVISSEIEELLGLCDRILVMSRGEIRDELRREVFDRERILRAALHASKAA